MKLVSSILYCSALINQINMENKQEQFWAGQFGQEYTDRNTTTNDGVNDNYKRLYGLTRSEMNHKFLSGLPKDISILEVGCNTGMQLINLQAMGFANLNGIELQPYAVEKSKEITKGINIIQGSAFDIPFDDDSFDLVFTSGVLIHINPNNLSGVFKEMYRVSKRYIWGFEYFADEVTEINYRGNKGVLWKADYAKLLADEFPGKVTIIKKEVYPYLTESERGNNDAMYLLEKVGN